MGKSSGMLVSGRTTCLTKASCFCLMARALMETGKTTCSQVSVRLLMLTVTLTRESGASANLIVTA